MKVREDLDTADRCLAGKPIPAGAAFHAQQAAEKSFKALLTWHGQEFHKTHNLIDLGKESVRVEPSLAAIASEVAAISGYAVETRYPGDWVEPDDEEAAKAVTLAKRLSKTSLRCFPVR